MDYPIKLSVVNEFITCPVCHGYLIDATTVCECLHTFCRDCIVKHIKNNNNECPKCNTVIHERRPLDYILHDQGKQDLVYKIVPQLYISEMLRKLADRDIRELDPVTRQVVKKNFLYVALVHQRKKATTFVSETLSNNPASQQATQQQKEQQQANSNVRKIPSFSPIYLKCPFKVRVLQLRKLLAVKYQLKASDRVSLLYKGDIVSDTDQISNLGQSISFVLHYEISRLYPNPDQAASTSSSTMSNDSDKMSIEELK